MVENVHRMASNLIQLQNGFKQYGPKILFDDASFAINADEHVGVIGPNGAGKSTLFKVLLGLEELDKGTIIQANRTKIAYLSQQDFWAEGETAHDYFEKLKAGPLWELEQIAPRLGLTRQHLTAPILSLSGGYRMRIKILGLVGQSPDLMLLDEPTNYLDLETTLVLERFLQSYEKAFLLISHDREFLKRTTEMTLEVEAGDITKYPGNIDDYFEQKALMRQQLQTQAASQAAKRKTVLDFVARFGAKATKAKQAQSRLKSLDRMEKIDLKEIPTRATIRIPPPARVGKIMLTVKNAVFGYGKKPVVAPVDLYLGKEERLAVVGFNGAGKSTLLKGISNLLAPFRGSVELGYEVTVGYFAQHVAEALDPKLNVFESLDEAAGPDITPQQIRDLAGSLLFSGEDIQKKVSVLSGGEKTRVALGQILLQRANILVLDEPTNHLDFDTVEALIKALQNFPGAVIFVSHDRGFVSRVATKLLSVEKKHADQPAEAAVYLKSYDEYLFETSQVVFAAPPEEKNPSEKPDVTPNGGPSRERIGKREKRIEKIELRLSVLGTEMENLTREIESFSGAFNEKNQKLQNLAALSNESAKLEEEWLSLQE